MSPGMKILIDATGVTRQKAGVGVYAKNLIDHLSQSSGLCEFYVLAQDDDPELDFGYRANVTMIWVQAKFFRRVPLRLLLEQIYLPCLLRRRGIEVVHSLHYAFPYFSLGVRRVVTIHDMTFFTMPEVHEKLKIRYFRFFIRAAVRSVDAIIYISKSAQNDCIALLGEPSGSYRVIPHGKDETMQPERVPAKIERLREKYALPDRFVLYIGTLEPRKNLDRLVAAFAEVAARDATLGLVLAGKKGWMMDSLATTIKRFGLESRVVFTGFILEEEKPVLLGACIFFVYPSLYEGFGLPVLEALACGAPTITSNTSSLPEVAGDAALLIDPLKTADLASAMQTLLSDLDLQYSLRTRGLERAKQFTWQKTASATAEVYLSVLSSR